MTWTLKKQYIGKYAYGMKKPLHELTKEDIAKLSDATRNTYFVESKPKTKNAKRHFKKK